MRSGAAFRAAFKTTIGGVDFDTFTVDQAQLLVQTGVDTSGVEVA